MTHLCRKCNRDSGSVRFHKNSSKPTGLSSWCIECRKVYDGSNRKNYRVHQVSYRRKRRAKKLLGSIRTRAKKHGITYDLDRFCGDIQRRIDAGCCEMTGVAFDLDSPRAYNTPSIDRIDPSKGYVYGNIRVVCLAMNCALNKWGEDVLALVMTDWLARRQPSPPSS